MNSQARYAFRNQALPMSFPRWQLEVHRALAGGLIRLWTHLEWHQFPPLPRLMFSNDGNLSRRSDPLKVIEKTFSCVAGDDCSPYISRDVITRVRQGTWSRMGNPE